MYTEMNNRKYAVLLRCLDYLHMYRPLHLVTGQQANELAVNLLDRNDILVDFLICMHEYKHSKQRHTYML